MTCGLPERFGAAYSKCVDELRKRDALLPNDEILIALCFLFHLAFYQKSRHSPSLFPDVADAFAEPAGAHDLLLSVELHTFLPLDVEVAVE